MSDWSQCPFLGLRLILFPQFLTSDWSSSPPPRSQRLMGKRKCDRKEGGAIDAMFPPRRPLQDQEAMECSDLDRLHG